MIIRPAKYKDLEDIFCWRNDEASVAMSLSGKKIEIEEHQKWFKSALNDDQICIYICQKDSSSIGMVRFDIVNEAAMVSINIAKDFRGKGLAKRCLSLGIEYFLEKARGIKVLEAKIRQQNLSSISVFKANGFELETEEDGILSFNLKIK